MNLVLKKTVAVHVDDRDGLSYKSICGRDSTFLLWKSFDQNGNKKENIHRTKIYFGTKEDGKESFHKADFMLKFSSCNKTKLPVDPFMAFMITFG